MNFRPRCDAVAQAIGEACSKGMTLLDSRISGDPGTPAFQLRAYPFFLLNRLASRYNKVIERRLRTIGIDIPCWRVLMILGEQAPRGVRDIADAAVIPLSTMTRIIQRMAGSGFVAVAISVGDARVTEVALSPAGEAKLHEARRVTAPVYAEVIRGLAARDFDRLIDLLDRLHDNLEMPMPNAD